MAVRVFAKVNYVGYIGAGLNLLIARIPNEEIKGCVRAGHYPTSPGSRKVKCNVDTFLIIRIVVVIGDSVSRANRYSSTFSSQWIRSRATFLSLIVNNLNW